MSATKEKDMVPGQHVIGTFGFAGMSGQLLCWAELSSKGRVLPQGEAQESSMGTAPQASESYPMPAYLPLQILNKYCVVFIVWSSGPANTATPSEDLKEKKGIGGKPVRHFRYLKRAVLFPRVLNIFLRVVVPPVIQFQVPVTVLVLLLIVQVSVTGDLKQRCSLGAKRPSFI